MTPLNSDEIKHIASASAKEAVKELLVTLGIDASDPKALIEMQKDFAHIRKWRNSVDAVGVKTLLAATGIVVTFIAGGVWLQIKGG